MNNNTRSYWGFVMCFLTTCLLCKLLAFKREYLDISKVSLMIYIMLAGSSILEPINIRPWFERLTSRKYSDRTLTIILNKCFCVASSLTWYCLFDLFVKSKPGLSPKIVVDITWLGDSSFTLPTI